MHGRTNLPAQLADPVADRGRAFGEGLGAPERLVRPAGPLERVAELRLEQEVALAGRRERRRAHVQGDGGTVVLARRRALTTRDQVPPRGSRQRAAVRRPELGVVLAGPLEVVADDLALLHQAGAVLLQPRREAGVEVGPRRLWHRVVRRVTDQEVAEPEAVVARKLRRVRPDQVLADECRQARRHRRLRRRQRLHAAAVEDLSLDRAPFQHAALRGLELVEARREQRPERRRDDHLAVRLGGHRQHLLDEQRIAAGGARDLVAQLRARSAAGSTRRHPRRRAARGGASPATRHGARRAQGAPCRAAGSGRPTTGARRARSARARVARPTGCRRRRPPAARRRRPPRASCGRPRRSPRRTWTRPPRPAATGSRAAAAGSRGTTPACCHDLDDGRVGDAVAIRQAAAAQGGRLGRGQELRGEPRLADAGLADDRDELATSLGPDTLPRAPEDRRARPRDRRTVPGTTAPAPGGRAAAGSAGTGSAFPRSRSGSIASTSAAAPTRSTVGRPSSTSPGCAACSSRAAMLTASPVARRSSVPVITSPVMTPMRPSRPSAGSASRISAAARTARSASSSCSSGTPNTAITASPMNFSTVPPWCSTITFMRSKYAASTARCRSGSSCSPSAVEPTTSQNSTVTTLRCPRRDAAMPGRAPHSGQNLNAPSETYPQIEQAGTRPAYARVRLRTRYPAGGAAAPAFRGSVGASRCRPIACATSTRPTGLTPSVSPTSSSSRCTASTASRTCSSSGLLALGLVAVLTRESRSAGEDGDAGTPSGTSSEPPG